ncbi:MAG: PIN domain-containing protein [Geobacter sp.]|nr:PIN domain-containing protein [Geobacter sp.]
MRTDGFLPDTCAWIDFFNNRQTPLAVALKHSLLEGRVYACGVIKYELVQGVKSEKEEKALIDALHAVDYLEMTESLWIKAGRLSGALRKKGVTIPFSDVIVALLAQENNLAILTVDKHFEMVPGVRMVTG